MAHLQHCTKLNVAIRLEVVVVITKSRRQRRIYHFVQENLLSGFTRKQAISYGGLLPSGSGTPTHRAVDTDSRISKLILFVSEIKAQVGMTYGGYRNLIS